MFAATVQNATTRLYLTDGTAGARASLRTFWRTDNANQPAATSSRRRCPRHGPARGRQPVPAVYNGLAAPVVGARTGSPYYATFNFCTGSAGTTPASTPNGMPDTDLRDRPPTSTASFRANTKGVGCGTRSNGRGVLYSDTAATGFGNNNRTFTDLNLRQPGRAGATWCALQGISPCLRAPNNIHPDQHQIVVNPSTRPRSSRPRTGGLIRTTDVREHLDPVHNRAGAPAGSTLASSGCCRGSRTRSRTQKNLDSLQFIAWRSTPVEPG